MKVTDLTRAEQVVLVGLARHVVGIDGELSDSELYELLRLGVEIGKDTFEAALAETEPWFQDAAATLAHARSVSRPDARAKITGELDRIARGDGLHDGEASFLGELSAAWR